VERAHRANQETGTGFACAKLSEIRSSRRRRSRPQDDTGAIALLGWSRMIEMPS
jgi:hypothetical protein